MVTYYKLKYYMNASHSFLDQPEKRHAHTFAITLFIEVLEEDFVAFYAIEKRLDQYFAHFSGQYLNDLEEFSDLDPTVENIGDYFYEELRQRLFKHKLHLMQLSISETPVRKYSISDKLLLSSAGDDDIDHRWEALMKEKEQFL
ncbi:MAG: 6-carboxytetrahydropterin synthase [Lachnospiraceae bacterium]|nr:6-carboxytetrahydropterin synthase [Lachnospiraceae bacterium]